MWKWILAHKGQKFKNESIWWAIDKPMEERLEAKKVGRAIQAVKNYLVQKEGQLSEDDLKKRILADWDNYFVLLRMTAESKAQSIMEKPRGQNLWTRAEGSPNLEGFDWEAPLASINAGP